MSELAEFEELIVHLARTSRLTERESAHLVGQVVAFLDDSVEQFVRRRHQELQREGLRNPQIYRQVAEEATRRRFRAKALSPRQIRRLIYG
jgi:hypothetical protein